MFLYYTPNEDIFKPICPIYYILCIYMNEQKLLVAIIAHTLYLLKEVFTEKSKRITKSKLRFFFSPKNTQKLYVGQIGAITGQISENAVYIT